MSESGDTIRVDRDGHVVRITIDRQHVANALDSKTTTRLNEVWESIESDPDVWCVVLTGAGQRFFCAGDDMSAAAIDRSGLDYWTHLQPNGFGGLSLRRTLPVPVIARVNGYALGGGMELLLGCDIVVASATAQFGLTEPRVGRLPLDGGVVQLVRRIPHTQAMSLLLTGRRVSAAEMYRMGLVNEVVEPDMLDPAVDRWVGEILACAPLSVRAIKQMVLHGADLSAADARRQMLPALAAALDSDDAEEGVRAFQEKRPPVWTGE